MKLPHSLILVVVVVAPGCLVDTTADGDLQLVCAADAECPEGRTCVEGFCLTPEQIAVPPVAFEVPPAFVGAGTDADESVRSDKPGKSAFHVTFTLNQKLALDRVTATFDGQSLACDDVAAPLYSCAGEVNDATPPGVRPVSVVVRDAIGREAQESLLLTVDKQAPVANLLDVAIERDGVARGAAGDGSIVTITFAFDEAPADLEVAGDAPGNEPFALEVTGNLVTATLDVIVAGVDEGVRGLRVTASDRVENEAAIEIDDVFVVDTTTPAPPDVDTAESVLHVRAPWGRDDNGGVPEQRLGGVAGAVEAGAVVEFSASGDLFQSLGSLQARDDGAFDAVLPIGDLPALFVRSVDAAGNASAPVRVRDGVWIARAARPAGSPENPLLVDVTPALGRALVDDQMTAVDGVASLAEAGDAATLAASTAGRWRERAFASPPPARRLAPLARHAGLDEVVLFGGEATALLDDTWVFDGERWEERTPPRRPPARRGHGLAHDPIADVIVLFGGRGEGGDIDDTWLWDGSAWTPVAGPGPSARSEASMATHPDGGVVLFGGRTETNEVLGDTWRFDARARTWTDVTGDVGAAPPARSSAGLALDVAEERVVLMGGGSAVDTFEDTWALTAAGWLEVPSTESPGAQGAPGLAWDAGAARLVLVGTDSGETQTRVFTLGTAGWEALVPASPPPVRTSGGFASTGTGAVLFGGSGLGAQLLGDAFVLEARGGDADFLPILDDTPPAFLAPVAEYDALNGRVIVVGAAGGARRTWTFDGVSWRELFVDGGTVGALAVNAAGELVQVGAASSIEVLGLLGWASRGVTSVVPLGGGTTAAFDGANIIAVGATSAGYLDETTDGWVTADDPGARSNASLSFAGTDGAVLFGGSGACGARCADTWVWSGTSWTEANGSSPPARTDHALVLDAARDEVLLFGGTGDGGALDDTWAFRDGGWRQLDPAGAPAARVNHALAWDDVHRRAILFGGTVGVTATTETWEWRGGGDDRAAVIVRAPFAAASVDGALVTGITVGAVAGGTGRPAGTPVNGVTLFAWSTTAQATGWVQVDANDAASSLPEAINSGVAPAAALVGADRVVHVALAPTAASGVAPSSGAADLVVDAVSVAFSYRLP